MNTPFKYIYKGLLFTASLAMTMASCDKLDEVPDNRTEIDTAEKVRLLLTSGYPQSVPAVICELSGDNLVDNNVCVPATHNDAYSDFHEEAYRWQDINKYSTGEDDTPYGVWEANYQGIAVCNHAIEAMKEMSADPANDPELSASWGEAHILRAYMHFVLVNVFAEAYKNDQLSSADRGIPYVTKPETTVQVDYSQSEYLHSVKETYDLIEKDILEGIDLIDNSNYKVPAYHFNKNATYAFAARFYLYKRQYDKVEKYATAALGANPSSSLRKWNTMSTNTINSMLNSYNDETAACNFLIVSTYSLQDRMLSACRFAINDGNTKEGVRSTKSLLLDGGGPNWSGSIPAYSGKIYRWNAGSEYGSWLFRVYEYFEYTDKIAGIGYVHILYQPFTAEETLLCRAEARLYMGNQAGALQDLGYWTASKLVDAELTLDGINKKYDRSSSNIYVDDLHPAEMGFSNVLASKNDQAMLDCILHFRRIETNYEGLRWFDIKRYGITVTHVYQGPTEEYPTKDVLTWDDKRRVLQIPNNVITAGYPTTDRTHTATNQSSSMTSSFVLAQ